IEIVEVELLDALGRPGMMFKTSESIVVRIHFVAHRRIEQPVFGIAIYRDDGMHISGPNTCSSGFDTAVVEGTGYVDYCVEALPLLEGAYELSATAYDTACLLAYDHHHRMYNFAVESGAVRETYGAIYIPSEWRLHRGG
ncbi:MAG: Wzt carbohydrate-binding domain-containing protein, partial [Anaerolineae bacterium]|nr:Wzt carbohydrate-binding domain-containing protein [Anaerolineae bacterium]